MVKATLYMAMDFAKRKDVTREVVSYCDHGQWRVIVRGPGYCNVYHVTEYDDAGLALLKSKEDKEAADGYGLPSPSPP